MNILTVVIAFAVIALAIVSLICLLILAVFCSVILFRALSFNPPEGAQVSAWERLLISFAYTMDRIGMSLQRMLLYGPWYPLKERQLTLVDDLDFHTKIAESEWAECFYPEPDLPEEVSEARMSATNSRVIYHGSFESTYKPVHPEFEKYFKQYENNQWVYYRRHKNIRAGANAPTCIFIHGWTGGDYRMLEFMTPLRLLMKLGMNVVYYIHVYHGPRKPVECKFSGEYWLSGDIVRTIEGNLQDVYDLRTLIRILRTKSKAPIGLWGGSGGAFLTNLTVPFEEVDFAISMVPPATLSEDVIDLPLTARISEGLNKQGIDRKKLNRLWGPISPLKYKPIIPKDKLLIVAGLGDGFIPVSNPLRISKHWGDSKIVWYPGGHALHFGRRNYEAEIKHFLKSTLSL